MIPEKEKPEFMDRYEEFYHLGMVTDYLLWEYFAQTSELAAIIIKVR